MPYPNPRTAPPNGPGTCPRCHRAVLWCITDANRRTIAVDPAGNQAVHIDPEGRYWTRQLSNARPAIEQREVRRRPHIATCPLPEPRRIPAPRIPRARLGVRPIRQQR